MKKGITAVSVSIMVVIIITLLGTITVASYNSIQNAKKITFSLEISNIQEKFDRYMKMAEEGDYPVLTNSYNISISNVSEKAKEQFEGENVDSNNQLTVYELDLAAIDIEDTQYGNKETEKDVYVISKNTNKVYYLEGVKLKDNTYYTLTEELIELNRRNEKKEDTDSTNLLTIETNLWFNVKRISNTQNEIYLSNIKVVGDDITEFKYELGIIEESVAKEYFKNNGKDIIGDRIKMSTISDITLYARDSKGNNTVKHIYDIIPEKFSMSIYPNETEVENGLVIYEVDSLEGIDRETAMTTYNQFVWVPVPNMDDFVRKEGYSNGKPQTFFAYSMDATATEPFSKTTDDGITLSATNDLTGEYAEYAAMKASVEKYGGFYIARYEASKETVNGVETAVSKKGILPWADIPWGDSMVSVGTTGAVAKSRTMYDETYEVKSHLPYAVQWDAVMTFIGKNYPDYISDSSGAGQYRKDKDGNQISNESSVKCGSNDAYERNNIYDMAGNAFEWTMEAAYKHSRVRRGGSWAFSGYDTPVSHRNTITPEYVHGSGFRPVLYLK